MRVGVLDIGHFCDALDDLVHMRMALAANGREGPAGGAGQGTQGLNEAIAYLDVLFFPGLGREILVWFCGDAEDLFLKSTSSHVRW